MKKLLQFTLFSISLLLGTNAIAQSSGIFESYAILSINGGANTYYDMQAATANTDFNGANLGSFSGVNTLVMKGGENKTYKNGGCNINSSTFTYRVYLTSGGPSGTFVNINEPFGSNLANPGDQSWIGTSGAFNVLAGLAPGNYTIEAYSTANFDSCGSGTHFSSNSSANYKATFSFNPILVTATSGSSLSATYPTLAAAVTAINTAGIHTGTVVCSVPAGYTETAPAGGYVITATGTLGNTITFQKSGVGANPTFTANTTQTAGLLNDAIFKIIGGDYITIDGFTMLENANTTTATATNNMTEFGVALLNSSATDGPKNITIKNCTIDLNRIYTNTFGIYSNATHTSSTISTTLTTAAGGEHSNLVITGNTITDVNQGIVVIGGAAATSHNDGLVIGGSLINANTITNYGTAAAVSSYLNVSTTMNGVLIKNAKNFTVSYNTIASSNAVTTGTVRGVFVTSPTNAPTGTLIQSVENNNISVRASSASGALQGVIVETTTGNATTTLNINANNFNTFGHSVASSGVITYISNTMANLNISISNNTFTNMSVNTTGSVTFISNSVTLPATGTKNVNGNSIVTAFNKTGAGGTVTLYNDNASSPTGTTVNNNNNNFSNITLTGATIMSGWVNTDGGAPTKTVTANTFTNWTCGSSAVTVLTAGFSGLGNVSGNTINTISGSGSIIGLLSNSGNQDIYNNTIHTLTTTGAFSVTAMSITGGTTQNIYKNKIYNLESNNASGTVNGLLISSGTTITAYNNVIGDLRTPTSNAANPLVGINITGGTTVNAFHNTVRLAGTSSGALFGSSAISVSTTPNVTLRNNIFINNATFTGTGLSVAYRRSSTTLTTYNASSNNNIFYAGTPSANNVIFYDGTTVKQTLVDYKTLLSTRDQASQTENTTFQSTSGSDANFLRIAAGITTYAESGASPITTPSINTDYWSVARPFSPATPAYNAVSGTVDIGASEFDGIPNLVSCIAPADQATAYVAGAVTSNSASASFTAATSAPTGYLVVSSNGTPFVGTPSDGTAYSPGNPLGNGAVIQSGSSTTITLAGLPSNTTGNLAIYSYNSGSCAGGPKYNLVSPLTGTNTTCAGTPTLPVTNVVSATGFTANWTQTGGTAFPITYTIDVTTDAAFTLPVAGSPFTSSTTSLVVSGLNPATTYFWRVKGNNTVCDSAYLSGGSVTTECAAITVFPSVEPFATYLPTVCWKEGDLGDLVAGPALVSATASSWGDDGFLNSGTTGAAKLNIFSTADSDWILSPYYSIPATGFRVKYNVGATNFDLTTAVTNWEADDFVELLVSTSTTNWTVLKTYNASSVPSNLGQLDEVNLSAYNGQTVRFAFRGVEGATDGASDFDFFVDNFTVEIAPIAITVSSPVTVCNGDATTLTVSSANSNYAYTWSPASGLNTTTGATVIATPTTTTIYTVTAVDGSMNNSGTVTVTVNAKPSASTLGSNSPVCEGDTLNLTNTPVVLPGYSLNSNSGVAFVDIATSGTSVGTPADDSEHNITIPSFTFNGVPYTTARISNNGAVVFGATTGDIWYGNLALPVGYAASNGTGLCTSSAGSLAAILANWDDMTTSATAGLTKITTQTVGGLYIIQWTSEDNFNATGTGTITFQIQLEIATGKINLVYPDITYGAVGFDNGQSATIGLNYSATSALQYSLNTASLIDGQSLTFTPNSVNYSWAGPNSFTSTVQNPVIPTATTAAAGTYTLTVTNPVTGCFSTSTTSVIVNSPVMPTFNTPVAICAGGVVALPIISTNGITGTWSPLPDNNITTVYTFTPTAGQCATTGATLTQTVTPNITPTFATATSVCYGDTAFSLPLTSTEGITGTWNPTFDNLNSALYTFTPTTGQCATTSTLSITITAPSIVPTFTQVAPICSGDIIPGLPTTSNNGVSGIWLPAIDNTVTTVYTFTPTLGQCATTATMTIAVGTTTTWVGLPTGWNNGAPTSISSAVISAPYSEAANITACTLTVSAVATIPTGYNVDLQGAITVNSGSFTLSNNANLIQSRNVTNTGNIIVKRETSPLKRQDYVLWSAPVAGQFLQSFSPGTLANRFYTYNAATDVYNSVNTPATTAFALGTGYLIRVPNAHPTTATILSRTFTGVPNNGSVALSVTNNTYNAIGNPYPSTINADAFITANGLTEALYFWRKDNNVNQTMSPTTSYATYTLAGGVGTAANTVGGSSLVPNGIIQVGQGFIAKATSTSLNFTNAMRVANNGNQFFRTAEDRSRVWLNLTNTDGLFSQALVAYMPNATSGIDAAIDGRLLNDIADGSALSSLINNQEFAVQGRALPFETTDVVPMAFKAATAGNYTIAVDHTDGLFTTAAQAVYLKDNLLATTTDLATPYTFASNAGVFNNRFEIVYQPAGTLATVTPTLNDNNVIVYKQNEDIVINTGKIVMANVKIFDIRGRLLIEKSNINATDIKINTNVANQVLIVKITSNNNEVVTKKVIN